MKGLRLWVRQKTAAGKAQAILSPCYSREEQFAPVLTSECVSGVFYDAT